MLIFLCSISIAYLYVYFWLIRSFTDPAYTSNIFVCGPLPLIHSLSTTDRLFKKPALERPLTEIYESKERRRQYWQLLKYDKQTRDNCGILCLPRDELFPVDKSLETSNQPIRLETHPTCNCLKRVFFVYQRLNK